jgi:OmcA/MtrC family decaheme c-type cytochrome
MCHHADNTNDDRVARVEGTTVTARSVHLSSMIHSIHRGRDHVTEYVLGGFPAPSVGDPEGTPIDFGELRYPGDLRDCESCHAPGTYRLPIARGALPTREEELTCTEPPGDDGDSYCSARTSVESWLPPETAACTACHDAPESMIHAQVSTTLEGLESCSVCHEPGRESDVDLVHALDP